MLELVRPGQLETSVIEANYDLLARAGVTDLAYDVDNTLVTGEAYVLPAATRSFLRGLVEGGRFRSVTLATNSRRGLDGLAASVGARLYQPRGRVRKPSRAYYLQIVQGLACEPRQIAFFDDKLLHVMGAMRAGMQGVLVRPLGNQKLLDRLVCRYQLERLLVRLWQKFPPKSEGTANTA